MEHFCIGHQQSPGGLDIGRLTEATWETSGGRARLQSGSATTRERKEAGVNAGQSERK